MNQTNAARSAAHWARRAGNKLEGVLTHMVMSSGLVRQSSTPNLLTLAAAAESTHLSADDLLEHCLSSHLRTDLRSLRTEFADITEQLRARYAQRHLCFPQDWAIEDEASFLLYSAARLLKPQVVLETGVANGHSTFYLLTAILTNAFGILHSTDITENVGQLVNEREMVNWSFHRLSPTSPERDFTQVVQELPGIGMFVHDSRHTYRWQRFEYKTVYPKMAERSVMTSDDVDASFAFLDFCRSIAQRPVLLVGKRKVFGVLLNR